jgi:hypothetical protein
MPMAYVMHVDHHMCHDVTDMAHVKYMCGTVPAWKYVTLSRFLLPLPG